MRCAHVGRVIERYCDGVLAARLAERVRTHLEGCERCRAREKQALSVARAFRAPGGVPRQPAAGIQAVRAATGAARAPEGFAARVMEVVYHEERGVTRRGGRSGAPNLVYRRLGYSFVATAAVLAVSLVVPRMAYSGLIRPQALAAELAVGKPAVVADAVNGAGLGFRRLIETDGARPESGF